MTELPPREPRVTLVFPPPGEPRAPYLALPTLAATLRAAGIAVTMHDANLAAFQYFLSPGHIDGLRRELAPRLAHLRAQTRRTNFDEIERAAIELLLSDPDLSGPQVAQALGTLRDAIGFYDPAAHQRAYDLLLTALNLIAVRHAPAVLTFQDFLMRESRYIIAELLAATTDRRNPFLDFFQRLTVPAIMADNPTLVGISVNNAPQMIPAFTLGRLLRARGVSVVMGGAHPTRLAEAIDARWFAAADGFTAFDGEPAIVELARRSATGGDWAGITNLITLANGAVLRPRTYQLADLAAAPAPDFSGLPLSEYFSPEPVLPYDPARGCPWNRCAFCDIPYASRQGETTLRLRPPATVARDLAALRDRHQARHFIFTAEGLTPEYLAELSGELLAANANIFWLSYARMEDGFTADVLRQLLQAGCRKLLVGLETASDRILTRMNKGLTAAQAQAFIDRCAAAGMPLHLFLIYGFPDETAAETEMTFALLERNREFLARPENSVDLTRYGYTRHSIVAARPGEFGVSISPDGHDAAPALTAQGPGLTRAEIDMHYEQLIIRLNRLFPQRCLPFGEEHALLWNSHRGQFDGSARR